MAKEFNETNNQTVELLKRLSLAIGVSGYSRQNSVQEVVTAKLTRYADRVERDHMGSIIGIKSGRRRTCSTSQRLKV